MTNKLKMERFESTNKWEPERFYIEHGDITSKHAVTGFGIERNAQGALSMDISFDASREKGSIESLKKRIGDLLDGSGIEDYEIKASPLDNDFSVVLKNADAGDLTRMAGALSNDVRRDNDVPAYSLLDKDIVLQIAGLEIEALGDSDLFSVTVLEGQDNRSDFITYNSHIPGVVITALHQDAQLSNNSGPSESHEISNIYFDESNKNTITQALEKSGLSFKAGKTNIRVEHPIAEVSQHLSNAGLLPSSANAGIQTQFAEVRSEFSIAAEVKPAEAKPTPAPVMDL